VKNRKLLVLILALALGIMSVLLLSACGTKEETTTTAGGTGTTGAAAATGEDLVIGVINSMTGVNALTGAEQKWAQEQAAIDQNAKGGIKLADGKMHKIVLKFVDDKSSDTEAAAAMEKLIKSDGLKIILSSNTTPYNQAAATVAEQYQAYFQINTAWIDKPDASGAGASFIGGMNLKWSSDIFEAATQAGKAAIGGAQALGADTPKIFAVMTENNPDGIGFGDGTVAGLKAAGFNVASYEKFNEGNKDFSSIILKFKQANVDGIVVLISPSDGITFVKQMKEQNWAPKYMFGYKGFWPVEFMKALGADSDYIFHDGFWSESFPYPGCKELGAAFSAAHDGATSVSIGLPYASAQILFTAIERAGVFEPAAVRDQVFNGTFKGTTMGDITYGNVYPDAPGIAHVPLLALQWMGGKRVVIFPTELSNGKAEVFKAWDQRK
jgi:branched-chain amino acid transport system substrate-binding protein